MASKSRRRGRRKSGSNSGSGGVATMVLAPGSVPTDEQLEEELREFESETKGT